MRWFRVGWIPLYTLFGWESRSRSDGSAAGLSDGGHHILAESGIQLLYSRDGYPYQAVNYAHHVWFCIFTPVYIIVPFFPFLLDVSSAPNAGRIWSTLLLFIVFLCLLWLAANAHLILIQKEASQLFFFFFDLPRPSPLAHLQNARCIP